MKIKPKIQKIDRTKIIQKENQLIPDSAIVKVIESGNIIDILKVEKKNRRQNGKMLNKDEYLVFSTGEIITCNHTKTRQESLQTLKHSMQNLRNIINANFTGGNNEKWITLTFGKNKIFDSKNLYPIFDSFMKRLRRYLLCENNQKIDYICVPEPHEKQDWHIHLLLIDKSGKDLYIPKSTLFAIWQQGFVKINKLEQVDNIGAYLSAYLTNTKDKKGARLYLYPANHNLYRKSKGIVKPNINYMSYGKAKEKIKNKILTYSRTYKIETPEGFTNTICHRQYKPSPSHIVI